MEERDVIIIGAGPAGLTASIFTRLDGWSTLILESEWVGGQGRIAYTVGNYPGFIQGDGAILMENMLKQVKGLGAEVRMEKVLNIDADKKSVETNRNRYKSNTIILATGSVMQSLNIPGEEKFSGKGVSYYAKKDYIKFGGKRVVVIGGGNVAAKSAILAKKEGDASEVKLLHRRGSLRMYPPIKNKLEKIGLEILYNTEVLEVKGESVVESIRIKDNRAGKEEEIPVDWLVICTGTVPDNELARVSGLKMCGDFVEVDSKNMTNKAGIFACGEITGCDNHLINVASEGALCGKAVSEFLAMELVKRGERFEGARNGKYFEEYLEMNEQSR